MKEDETSSRLCHTGAPPRLEKTTPVLDEAPSTKHSALAPGKPNTPPPELRPSKFWTTSTVDGDSSEHDSKGGVSALHKETRLEKQSKAEMDATQELLRILSEADSDSCAEKAIYLVGEYAFGTIEDAGMLQRQVALDEAGVFQKLVDIVGEFIFHVEVVTLALSIFGGIRIDEGVLLHVSITQTLETVIATLQIHKGDAQVIRNGLCVVCRITKLDDVRAQILQRCDAIQVVMDCLKQHSDDEDIQTEGARFVSSATMNSEINRTELAKSGGIGRLLRAARDFGESRILCTNACIGLRNITVGRPDIVKIALGLDAVDGLLKILSQHGDAYMTTTNGLAGLLHMTGCEAGIRRVLRHEGWEVILVESFRRHTSRAGVQAFCLAIMGRIAIAGGSLAARKMKRYEIAKMALFAMHRFVNCRAVLYFGVRLLRVLLEQDGGMEDVGGFDGFVKLLDLLHFTVGSHRSRGSGEKTYSGHSDILN